MTKQTHIGAYGLIENQGKILLAKHQEGPYKGLLGLPGGSFVHGETARQCITRQIQNESSLDISEIKLFDVLTDRVSWDKDNDIEDLHLICILFNIHAKVNRLIDDRLNWFDISTIDKSQLSPIAQRAINDYNKINA